MTRLTDRLRRGASSLLVSALLAACGGAGQDGTGAAPDTQTSGVVNGFGSVVVNGIHFDVDNAQMTIDGVPGARQSDLRVGMVVTVNGTLAADGTSGSATTLAYESLLNGSIDEAPSAAGLRVLGQRVQVDQTTLFAGFNDPSELRLGDRLQVSGFRDPDGSLRATWIQRESGAAAPQIAGFIATVAAGSVRVAGLQIDISNAVLIGVAPAALAPGQLVRVVLKGPPVAGSAVARQLSLIDLRLPETVSRLRMQGIVDGWSAGTGRFGLNGQAVQIGAATQYEDGSVADLANGARVEVSGPRNDERVLVAERIRIFRPLLTAYGRGKVSAVDIEGRNFTLFGTPGIEVRLRAATLLNDTSVSGGVLRLANLSVGDEVFVLGGDNGNRIDALLVQRLPRLTPGSGVGGPVGGIAGTTLTVLGIAVNTGSATQFYDAAGQAQTSAEFLAGLQTGDIVRAEGVQLGQALAALVVRRVR